MLTRTLPLALALAALTLAAPTAGAAVSDRYLPIYDGGDGLTVSNGRQGQRYLHFSAKAAKIYRRIGGRKAFIACGQVAVPSTGGPPTSGGYGATGYSLPRTRTRVTLDDGLNKRPPDVCTIATARVKSDGRCIPNGTDDPRCVRVIVALTDVAGAYLDARARAIDLWLVKDSLGIASYEPSPIAAIERIVGRDVVALTTPDDVPPPGKVGVFLQGDNYALATLLQDGRRQFVRFENPVYSTNVYEFIRGEDEEHTIFSVFL
jgi:hypothetical protein